MNRSLCAAIGMYLGLLSVNALAAANRVDLAQAIPPANAQSTTGEDDLKAFEAKHEQSRAELKFLIAKASELSTVLKALNRSIQKHNALLPGMKKLKSDDPQINELRSLSKLIEDRKKSLFSQFPGLSRRSYALIDEKKKIIDYSYLRPFLEEENTIRAALNQEMNRLEVTCSPLCFNKSKQGMMNTAGCNQCVKNHCYEFKSESGGLAIEYFDNELEVHELPMGSANEYVDYQKKKLPPGYYSSEENDRFDYLMCKVAVGQNLKFPPNLVVWPGKLRAGDEPAKWDTGYVPALVSESGVDQDSYVAECIEIGNLNHLRDKLQIVARRDSYHAPYAIKDVKNRIKKCAEATQGMCGPAYIIKNQIVLTYLTTDCRSRDVTSGDVENDISEMAESGSTEADRLQHSLLNDVIKTCQRASAQGFFWEYSPPKNKICNSAGR